MTTPIVKNDTAVFGWGFMLAYAAMVAAFTWILVRDGAPPGYSSGFISVVMLAFWLAAIGGLSHVLRLPRTSLSLDGDALLLAERWPLARRDERIALYPAPVVEMTEEKDSEGDPYHVLSIATPSGRRIRIHEGHHLPDIEAARDRLLSMIAGKR